MFKTYSSDAFAVRKKCCNFAFVNQTVHKTTLWEAFLAQFLRNGA